jgi:hypothetical protein
MPKDRIHSIDRASAATIPGGDLPQMALRGLGEKRCGIQ